VFGIYTDRSDVGRAVEALKAAGFSNNDVSALFPENKGTKDFAHEKNTLPRRWRLNLLISLILHFVVVDADSDQPGPARPRALQGAPSAGGASGKPQTQLKDQHLPHAASSSTRTTKLQKPLRLLGGEA
jgi:hypothetical protein